MLTMSSGKQRQFGWKFRNLQFSNAEAAKRARSKFGCIHLYIYAVN